MPIYPIQCKCGYQGEAFAKVASLDARGRVPCPTCGKRAEQDYSQKRVGVSGDSLRGPSQDCHEFQCQPKEVKTLQRMYGDVGHMWQEDGSVKAKDRSDFKKFVKKDNEIRRKFKDKKEAKKAP